MMGHWKVVTLFVILTGSVGCRSQQTVSPTGVPANPNNSFSSRLFGPKYGPPKPDPLPTATTRFKGAMPEVETAFANAYAESAFMEGRSAVERDQLIDSARQKFQAALAVDPKNKAAYLGMAKMYEKTGDRDHAVQAYRDALKVYPKDHEMAHQLAVTCARLDDWEGSIQAANYALSLDPENLTYHKTLGYGLARQGRLDESLATFRKVMPESQSHYFLGRVLIDMNREDEGRKQIEMAIQMEPNHPTARDFLTELDAQHQPIRQASAEVPAQ